MNINVESLERIMTKKKEEEDVITPKVYCVETVKKR